MSSVNCPNVADWLWHLRQALATGHTVQQADEPSSYGFEANGIRYSLDLDRTRDMFTWFDTMDQQTETLSALDLRLGDLAEILASKEVRVAWFASLG